MHTIVLVTSGFMIIRNCDAVCAHAVRAHMFLRHVSLRWRHSDHAGVSNHQPHGCLLNRLFRRKSKKTSKLRVTGLCAGNSPGTGEFPAQMASYAENISIWWRHHVYMAFHEQYACRCVSVSSNENIFRVTGPLCGELTGHRWIPLTKASDAEL